MKPLGDPASTILFVDELNELWQKNRLVKISVKLEAGLSFVVYELLLLR